MEGEFNNLGINNAPITFTGKTNNIATSDELDAPLMYQDKLGTNYSRGKKAAKMVTLTGVALILTAAAIKTGSLLTNAFIVNVPTVENEKFEVIEGVLNYSFEITNKGKYQVYYIINVDNVNIVKQDCSNPDTYVGTFNEISDGQTGHFYIEFTNSVDYTKRITSVTFTNKGVTL